MKTPAKPARWLTAAAGLAPFGMKYPPPAPAGSAAGPSLEQRLSPTSFAFHHEAVLGTSLELICATVRPDEAIACEQKVLGEIDRLNAILSTYDPASEISRFARGGEMESEDLARVLAAYAHWHGLTGGAISARMAGTVALWSRAERENRLPGSAELEQASATAAGLNVDALGKGYIIDRAVEVARRVVPGGLLNIGGDLRAWGDEACAVGVADPFAPEENGAPTAVVPLREAAMATSGGYARGYTMAGVRYSHLIDPRTSRPVPTPGSATVIAGDCLTANALATAACVLGPEAGLSLIQASRDASGLLIAQGRRLATGLFAVDSGTSPPVASGSGDSRWPANFQVHIGIALRAPYGNRIRRPYVAVWVQDSQKKLIRTITLWGEEMKYVRELSDWWTAADAPWFRLRSIVASVGRATRPAGTYAVVWDGRDNLGLPVPMGDYVVTVEIARQNGDHVQIATPIACGTEPQSATLSPTTESNRSEVSYGP